MKHRFSESYIRKTIAEKLVFACLISSVFAFISYADGYDKVLWYPIPFIVFIFGVITITTYRNQRRLLTSHEMEIETGKIVITQFPRSLSLDMTAVNKLDVRSRRDVPRRIIGKMGRTQLFDLKGYERMDVLLSELKEQLETNLDSSLM